MSFLKTLAKKAVNPSSKPAKKGTPWHVTDVGVVQAIKDMISLDREAKSVEAKIAVRKAAVLKVAKEKFLDDYIARSAKPDSPMSVVTPDGDSVTFVVQDKSASAKVSDDLRDQLVEVIGKDATDKILYEETVYSFNREALTNPEVEEMVSKALKGLVEKVTAKFPDLSLIDVENKVAFRPSALDNLTVVCGKDRGVISRFMDALGGAFVRYVRT